MIAWRTDWQLEVSCNWRFLAEVATFPLQSAGRQDFEVVRII